MSSPGPEWEVNTEFAAGLRAIESALVEAVRSSRRDGSALRFSWQRTSKLLPEGDSIELEAVLGSAVADTTLTLEQIEGSAEGIHRSDVAAAIRQMAQILCR